MGKLRATQATIGLLILITTIAPLVAAAPTQQWRATFAGNNGGAAAGGCSPSMLDVDWASGDAFIAYTALDPTSAPDAAIWRRLSASSGGTTLGGDVTSVGVNSVGCGIALDQRGRVYFYHSPETVKGKIFDKLGNILTTYDPSMINIGGATGVYADTYTDTSALNTRFAFRGSSGFASWLMGSATTHAASQTCRTGAFSAGLSRLVYRQDSVSEAKMWGLTGDVNNERVSLFTTDTCGETAKQNQATAQFPSGIDFFSVTTPTIYWGEAANGGVSSIRIHRLDANDATDPIANIASSVEFTVTGTQTQEATNVYDLQVAEDGTVIICGSNAHSPSGFDGWFLEVNSAMTTINWIQTETSQSEVIGACRLGLAGAIYVAGLDTAPNPDVIFVEKWCCTNSGAGVRVPTPFPPQISFSGGSGGGEGAAGNPIAVMRTFCTDAWGFDFCGWLIIIIAVVIVLIAFARVNPAPFLLAIGVLLGVGLGVLFTGKDYVWLLFVVVFLLLGFAARMIMGDKEGE